MRADAAERVESGGLVLLALGAWLVPGSGHLWLGRRTRGFIFLIALTAMFAIGLALNGRLFPFEASQPLVFLAAFADLAMGLPYFLAWGLNLGQGQVAAVTYEYANAFLIVAGLLNMLVVLDAYDTAVGRK
jgi:heme/copper-type cytochrome/quinol oxidase subunit 4